MLIDYHIYTTMSEDAKGEPTEYLKIARNRGLAEIGVSDHYHQEEPKYSMSNEKLAQSVKKNRFSTKPRDRSRLYSKL